LITTTQARSVWHKIAMHEKKKKLVFFAHKNVEHKTKDFCEKSAPTF
jgi:hypothetical protein